MTFLVAWWYTYMMCVTPTSWVEPDNDGYAAVCGDEDGNELYRIMAI